MASWVLTQQWLISGVLILLLLNEYKASTYLGGRVSYLLWLLLPLCLMVNNLPQKLFINSNSNITHYLVSFNETTQVISQTFSWQVVWIIGVISILTTSLYATIKLHVSCKRIRLSKTELPVTLPKNLSVYHSPQICSPMLLGVLKPCLVLPTNYRSQFTHNQLKLVLEHEVCHFKRLDNLTNAMSVMLLSLCWFNPLAWAGYASFRRSQEVACDYVVLSNKDVTQRIEYSKALVNCLHEGQSRLTIYSNYYQRNTMFKRINILKNYDSINLPAKLIAGVIAMTIVSSVTWAKPLLTTEEVVEVSQQLQPTMRIEPRYPIKAAKGGVEGSVVMRFDIKSDGSVSNVVVVKSVPEKVFDKEASRALKQWMYTKSSEGRKGEMVQLDFMMDDSNKKIKNLIEGIEKINVKNH